jgi:hypothetical protein
MVTDFITLQMKPAAVPEARRRAIRMKQQGTSPGFPDYCIIVPPHLIFIELKSKKGYASPAQKEWIAAINEIDNIEGFICRGAEAAIEIIKQYQPNQPAPKTKALIF